MNKKANHKETELKSCLRNQSTDNPVCKGGVSLSERETPGQYSDTLLTIAVDESGSNKKIMAHKSTRSRAVNNMLLFTPPTFHNGKEPYISFSAYDPATGRRKRKKYMLTRFKAGRERDFAAAQIIANIYNRLAQGWNPWMENDNIRGHVTISEAFDRYGKYINQMERKGSLKHKTWLDYSSRLRILMYYMETNRIDIMYCYQLNITFFVDFLDYVLLDRDDTARTRNNHRTWLSTLCTWLVQHQYMASNPIANIPMLREDEKFRQPLSPTDLHLLKAHLERTNKHYLLAVYFMYYTAIRPSELVHLRIRDIDVKSQTIYVYGAHSKNRRGEPVILNDRILRLMIELETFSHHGGCFIFGPGFMPGEQQGYAAMFRNEWFRLRERLGFPRSYQFYSLKDSGLRDLVKAEGAQAARDQARHRDVSTTNKYLQGRDKVLNEGTKHFEGEL